MEESSKALAGLLSELLIWLDMDILVLANLISFAVLVVTGLAAFIFRRNILSLTESLIRALPFKAPRGFLDFWRKVYFQFSWALILWLYNLAAAGLEQPAALTFIAGYLLGAWLIIQVIRTVLPDSVLVRFISMVIWVLAVLNIVGIYNPVVNFLESVSFNLGDFQLSLMLIIRGIVFFVIFFAVTAGVEKYLRKNIQKSANLTPSVSILLQKLLRITLFTAAFIIVLGSVGIDISIFAVLGGALGLGLGFGLQKIVSNFISGIIIILDRSIKPGDIIEIDDVFGKVRALNTRFVSIVTLAGKEYLIPNENFITNQVINWSYSDELVRLDTEVGVAYESDLTLARELMIKAMAGQARILEKPPPDCLLKEFGDSTVNFELRFWISDSDKGVGNIKSDVLMEVWKLLKDHKINIAFPQRDLHLKSVDPAAAEELRRIISGEKKAVQDSGPGDRGN